MNQVQYDIICTILRRGAPVLADDLIVSINNLIAKVKEKDEPENENKNIHEKEA